MSASAYALSLILLVATLVPAGVAARAVRAALLPAWTGAPAVLADAVGGLLFLVLVGELLGALGAFRAALLVATSIVAGTAVTFAAPRLARWRSEAGPPVGSTAPSTGMVLVCLAGAALVIGQWLVGARASFDQGMTATDTVWYHMPFAAGYVQQASITHAHFVELQPITAYFPANSELLHAIGIALFSSHDVLSPIVNSAFLALALLAGWCIGRPWGVAPIAMLGVALAAAQPGVWVNNAGQAGNDLVALTFFLAAIALLVNSREAFPGVVLAAVAGGLAVGTKLTLIGPVLALAAIAVALATRGKRRAHAAAWVVGIAVASGFWYLRNLFITGSPAPWFGLHLGPLSWSAPPRRLNEGLEFSVAHYITDSSVWRHYFLPGLKWGAGWGWWAMLALAAAGAIGAVVVRRDPRRRGLGVLALVCALVYLVTPSGAAGHDGSPDAFGQTFRYAAPAVALGLALLPAWFAAESSRRRGWVVGAFTLTLLLTVGIRTQLWHERRETVLFGLAVIAVCAPITWLVRGGTRRARSLAGALALLAVATVVGGFFVQRHYVRDSYAAGSFNTPPQLAFARKLHRTKIAVFGSVVTYQLYGRTLSNRIVYLGRHERHGGFTTPSSCPDWRAQVNAGRYAYVVVAPVVSPLLPWGVSKSAPPELRWTEADPAAHLMSSAGGALAVFRISGTLDSSSCPVS